ncbi:response regulator transcription factor [Bacillus sp. FJAT-49711]|uniref:response regulator transcription factor n=1 Tax=Bacillus sp. FJAT-49711 TaxID=2833585 RepID=UPI001BC8FC13|nr:response regulator transcription factor [Bacillus sp. FJAT-49711]MBS4218851.1 response regulator transcription factor [Bacillus sp. FJAT-49711]
MVTILIADDEKEIAELVGYHLEKEGYQVIKVHDGMEALQTMQTRNIDLAVLDIMMPKMDGYEVIREVREEYALPVIFLSAKQSDLDKITGLVMGADDYMSKPFNPMELVARVNAQLRRSKLLSQTNGKIHEVEVGGLNINLDERTVKLYGEPIELTPKEFDILYLLASYPKKVYSVENIFQNVWGEEYYEGSNTVMVHIRALRKKLKEDEHKNKFIKTVWGVGYTFNG